MDDLKAAKELFALVDELDDFMRSGHTRHGVSELRLRVGNVLDKYRATLSDNGGV